MTEELQRVDLETVECYMVVCAGCRRSTDARESENDALALATTEGYRVVGDDVCCQFCIPLFDQRLEEEAEEEREEMERNYNRDIANSLGRYR